MAQPPSGVLMLTLSMLFFAGTPTAEASSIINGEETDTLPQVVSLFAADEQGEGDFFCSGTVIGEQAVLTAAHCIWYFELLAATGHPNLWVLSGTDVSEDGTQDSVRATDWVAHPGFDLTHLNNDVGLVFLPENNFDFDVMPVNRDAITDAEIGTKQRYVGFGISDELTGQAGVKRFGDIPLNNFEVDVLFGYDPHGRFNACSGDSGGAVLEFNELGWEITGVISAGGQPEGDGVECTGGYTLSPRVDAHLEWIEEYTEVWSAEEWKNRFERTPEVDEEPRSAGCSTAPDQRFLIPGLALVIGLLRLGRRRAELRP